MRLRADLTRHCLGLDPDFLNAHTPGELIERIDGDVSTLANYFARFVIYVVGNALLIVGLVVLLFLIDWRVAAAVGVFLLLALVLMTSLRFVAVPHWNMARQASAELFGFLEERLLGTEDIRASGATGVCHAPLLRALASTPAPRAAGLSAGQRGVPIRRFLC